MNASANLTEALRSLTKAQRESDFAFAKDMTDHERQRLGIITDELRDIQADLRDLMRDVRSREEDS